MSELDALLGAARAEDDPSEAQRARVRASLAARVGGALGAGTALAATDAATAATTATVGAASSTLGLAKAGFLLVLLGGAATGGLLQLRGPSPSRPTQAAVAPSPTPTVAPRARALVAPARALVPVAAPAPLLLPPAAPAPAPRGQRPSAARPLSAEPEVAPSAEESRLLAEANRALLARAPERALELLALHRERFPRGVLAEDREAGVAQSLCASGRREEGAEAAQRFLRAHPRSVHAPRVRASCGL